VPNCSIAARRPAAKSPSWASAACQLTKQPKYRLRLFLTSVRRST
jgi:hypothetical protein